MTAPPTSFLPALSNIAGEAPHDPAIRRVVAITRDKHHHDAVAACPLLASPQIARSLIGRPAPIHSFLWSTLALAPPPPR
jgi:hypothetical protein